MFISNKSSYRPPERKSYRDAVIGQVSFASDVPVIQVPEVII